MLMLTMKGPLKTTLTIKKQDGDGNAVGYSINHHWPKGVGVDKGICLYDEEIEIPTPAELTEWLIWSNEHGAWWAPGHRGYVKSREKAGRYSFEEACMIVEGANRSMSNDGVPNEAMILDESC